MPFAMARDSAAGSSSAAAIKSTTGPAIAIGGGLRDDNSAVWSRLVGLAGGPGARFVVLATASGDPEAAARGTIAALTAHGALAVHLRVAPELKDVDLARAVRDPALIDQVRAANGVFFTGGDQGRIVDTLRPGGVESPLLAAIRELQQRGGVVAGTSAGAAIMSRTMFRDPASVITLMKGPMRPGQDFDAGLGFAQSDLFVDQHFLARGRLGRMLPLMQAHGMTLGVGVEEDSAAILHGDVIEVLGSGGALLVDLVDAATDAKLGAFNVSNARLTYMGHGDRYDLRTRTLTPARAKLDGQVIVPQAADFKPYHADAPFTLDVLAAGAVLGRMIRHRRRPGDGVAGPCLRRKPGCRRAARSWLRIPLQPARRHARLVRPRRERRRLHARQYPSRRRAGARRAAAVRPVEPTVNRRLPRRASHRRFRFAR